MAGWVANINEKYFVVFLTYESTQQLEVNTDGWIGGEKTNSVLI